MLHSLDQENLRPAETVLIFNWKSILDKFTESFQQTFSTSKKAHFDCLPPEFKIVDGARGKWCNLVLMDAILFFLSNDTFRLSSRRAFNQQKVLFDAIMSELDSEHNQKALHLLSQDSSSPSDDANDTATSTHHAASHNVYFVPDYTNNEMITHDDTIEVYGIRHPWSTLRSLLYVLRNDPTTKSKIKYLQVITMLESHNAFHELRGNMADILKVVIFKAVNVFNKRHLQQQRMMDNSSSSNSSRRQGVPSIMVTDGAEHSQQMTLPSSQLSSPLSVVDDDAAMMQTSQANTEHENCGAPGADVGFTVTASTTITTTHKEKRPRSEALDDSIPTQTHAPRKRQYVGNIPSNTSTAPPLSALGANFEAVVAPFHTSGNPVSESYNAGGCRVNGSGSGGVALLDEAEMQRRRIELSTMIAAASQNRCGPTVSAGGFISTPSVGYMASTSNVTPAASNNKSSDTTSVSAVACNSTCLSSGTGSDISGCNTGSGSSNIGSDVSSSGSSGGNGGGSEDWLERLRPILFATFAQASSSAASCQPQLQPPLTPLTKPEANPVVDGGVAQHSAITQMAVNEVDEDIVDNSIYEVASASSTTASQPSGERNAASELDSHEEVTDAFNTVQHHQHQQQQQHQRQSSLWPWPDIPSPPPLMPAEGDDSSGGYADAVDDGALSGTSRVPRHSLDFDVIGMNTFISPSIFDDGESDLLLRSTGHTPLQSPVLGPRLQSSELMLETTPLAALRVTDSSPSERNSSPRWSEVMNTQPQFPPVDPTPMTSGVASTTLPSTIAAAEAAAAVSAEEADADFWDNLHGVFEASMAVDTEHSLMTLPSPTMMGCSVSDPPASTSRVTPRTVPSYPCFGPSINRQTVQPEAVREAMVLPTVSMSPSIHWPAMWNRARTTTTTGVKRKRVVEPVHTAGSQLRASWLCDPSTVTSSSEPVTQSVHPGSVVRLTVFKPSPPDYTHLHSYHKTRATVSGEWEPVPDTSPLARRLWHTVSVEQSAARAVETGEMRVVDGDEVDSSATTAAAVDGVEDIFRATSGYYNFNTPQLVPPPTLAFSDTPDGMTAAQHEMSAGAASPVSSLSQSTAASPRGQHIATTLSPESRLPKDSPWFRRNSGVTGQQHPQGDFI